jgi:hypothetical protein
MNAGTVFKMLALIPERSARTPTGAAFVPQGTACAHPERFAQLLRFLNWLSPLEALSKDDQRALGLLAPNGRPANAETEEDEPDLEPEIAI